MKRFLLALILILSLLASACAGQAPASTVEPIPSPTNPAPAFTASMLKSKPKLAPEYADKIRYDVAVPMINVWKILASFTDKVDRGLSGADSLLNDIEYLNDIDHRVLDQNCSIDPGSGSNGLNDDETDIYLALNKAESNIYYLSSNITLLTKARECDRLGLAGDARKTKDGERIESTEFYRQQADNALKNLKTLENILRGYLVVE